MDVDTVLVPVDGTQSAMEAVRYAVAIADRYEARVHAVYVLGQEAASAIDDGSVEAAAVADRGEQIMAGVRTIADGVPVDHSSACGFSVSTLSQHPGSVILDIAETLGVEFIVVPRESVTEDSEAVIGKAAEYVIGRATQPVLSV